MIARALGALVLVVSIGFSSHERFDDRTGDAPGAAVPADRDQLHRPYAAVDAPRQADVQQAVNRAFAEVLPGEAVAFALESAQSSRIEGGGLRYDGTGIASWDRSAARFVAFTMTLSATGELVEFDYSAPQEVVPMDAPFEDALAAADGS